MTQPNHDRIRQRIADAKVVSDGTEAKPQPAQPASAKRGPGRPRKVDSPAVEKVRRPRAADFDHAAWIAANCAFICDRRGNVFMRTRLGAHERFVPVLSTLARYAIRTAGYAATGQLLGPSVIESILRQAEGKAQTSGPFAEPWVRVGRDRGHVCVDLGTDDFTMARITPNGWHIEPIGALPFVRPPGFGALPLPVAGGNINDLRSFLNTESEADFVLCVAWAVISLRPNGPFPMLAVGGEQGSGKSTAVKLLRGLVDPNDMPIRAQPRDEGALVVAASNNLVLGFDNASRFENWLSDLLCIVLTGGAIASRRLYSDTEEAGFNGKRPVIVSSIVNVANAPDLAQRSYAVKLRRISDRERGTEEQFWREWSAAEPLILGVIYDGVSAALRRLAEVETAGHLLPRMADAALWGTAAEAGLGFEPGALLQALRENENQALAESFENDSVAIAVSNLLPEDGRRWSGTMAGLLDALGLLVSESIRKSQSWPRTPQGLTAKLARIQPVLRSHNIVFSKTRGDVRTLHLERLASEPKT